MTDDHGSHTVLESMSLVSSNIHQVFPDIPVFPAFGNNDLPGHYILPNNSAWYRTILSYWAPLILCSECQEHVQKPTTIEALSKTFLDGGYYSVNIAGNIITSVAARSTRLEEHWSRHIHYDEILEKKITFFLCLFVKTNTVSSILSL